MSLPQLANTLVRNGRAGVLSTHSAQCPGFPFGSVAPYAADAGGSPIFLLSSLALHTRNIRNDSRASLCIQQENGSARMTILGIVEPASAGQVAQLYLGRHPDALQWHEFADFAYYRLTPAQIYLVEGFGSMGWIAAEEYRASSAENV